MRAGDAQRPGRAGRARWGGGVSHTCTCARMRPLDISTLIVMQLHGDAVQKTWACENALPWSGGEGHKGPWHGVGLVSDCVGRRGGGGVRGNAGCGLGRQRMGRRWVDWGFILLEVWRRASPRPSPPMSKTPSRILMIPMHTCVSPPARSSFACACRATAPAGPSTAGRPGPLIALGMHRPEGRGQRGQAAAARAAAWTKRPVRTRRPRPCCMLGLLLRCPGVLRSVGSSSRRWRVGMSGAGATERRLVSAAAQVRGVMCMAHVCTAWACCCGHVLPEPKGHTAVCVGLGICEH